jgi:hypothetical protein
VTARAAALSAAQHERAKMTINRENGFYLVELGGRKFDVCMIDKHARYIRSHDPSRAATTEIFDVMNAGEGTWREAGYFSIDDPAEIERRMSPTLAVADAIRKVTATVQNSISKCERANKIDTDDLIEMLLSIADEIDPR